MTLPPPSATRPAALFGTYRLETDSGELWREGRSIRLSDKPLQALLALLERPGELVSRAELQERLWPDGVHVDFDSNLNATMNKVREALGDTAQNPRFIETLPRKGYRFIAPVAWEEEDPRTVASAGPGPASASVSRLLLWGLLLVGTAAGLWWLLAGNRAEPVPAPSSERAMLAVLPLDDLSSEPHAWLADGLTEELIGHLARLDPERLGVIARISSMAFKGSGQTISEIGEVLGADYVIEGSVRREGDRIRFSAQLIRVGDQSHLWAESYDREVGQVLDIQSELAESVGRTLALQLLPGQREALARASTTETAAYDAYLQAREEWNRFSTGAFRRAIELYRQATEIDPDFALAWSGLADAASLLACELPAERDELFEQARRAALRALEIDPLLAEGHNSLAFVLLYADWDFPAAAREFERSLALSPGYAMAHHWTAGAYSAVGAHDRAVAAVRHALELDPVSQSVGADLGWYLLFADRYEEGVAECRRVLELGPNGWAETCVEYGLRAQGRLDEALAEMRAREEVPENLPADPGEAIRAIERHRLETSEGTLDEWPLQAAIRAALAGETELALDRIERAVENRAIWSVFLRVDPRLDTLHGHPRFEAIVERLGLASSTTEGTRS